MEVVVERVELRVLVAPGSDDERSEGCGRSSGQEDITTDPASDDQPHGTHDADGHEDRRGQHTHGSQAVGDVILGPGEQPGPWGVDGDVEEVQAVEENAAEERPQARSLAPYCEDRADDHQNAEDDQILRSVR